jgi:hypothetical protein
MGRMRSLKADRNDVNQLRWGRFRNMGACVASEYYQPCPFFFTREGAVHQMVGMYRGGSAFLIASGPSFKDVDKNLLSKAGVWTMTLNNAVKSFRGNAACIVDDPCRFVASLWLDPKITKFVPSSHFEKPLWDNRTLVDRSGKREEHFQPMNMTVGSCPNVIGYRRNEKFNAQRFLYEDTINWGNHKQWGGGRSVMLAALRILFLLGFRNVYLLGVDLDMNDDKKYHFDETRTNAAINGNMSTYSKLKGWFTELQPYFLAENFVVKNCNPASKLEVFPHISFADAIHDATWQLGDVENERTAGMYVKWEEKVADWDRKRIAMLPPGTVAPPIPTDLGPTLPNGLPPTFQPPSEGAGEEE